MALTEEKWNTCRTVVRKRERGRPRRGSRHRRCNNIKMALKEIGWGTMDWINLSQDTIIIIITYLLQLSFHSVAVVLTLVQTIIIIIIIIIIIRTTRTLL